MADLSDLTGLTQASPAQTNLDPKVKPKEHGLWGAQRQQLTGDYSDQELLDLWAVMKRECFDNRWIFERQWQRNIWYVLGRQWIEYQSKYGGWRDKRMAAWVPRPVTNKCKETVQTIRAMFQAISLSVNVRPNGSKSENVAAAATADELAPLLHEVHNMDYALTEFDFWLLTTGNAFFHTFLDYDIKNGVINIPHEQCVACGTTTPSTQLTGAQPVCPQCQGTDFTPAMDPDSDPDNPQPLQTQEIKGQPTTIVLSPLEVAWPYTYTRFDDLPYIVRSRWRTKRYYESHPILCELVSTITWQKAPLDHSMALFTSLAQTNDLGITPIYWSEGSGRGGQNDEGAIEHEVWMRPTVAYPQGLVFRIIGDAAPQVVHLEETESLPGPIPYTDAEGTPLFTFSHAMYEHVGGRILGSGPLDVIIQKQDQLNQLDSLILLIVQRMANPVWLEPKGCEIQKLTGMPGLVVKYSINPMGPNAKPERIPGIAPDANLYALRQQYLTDIEDLAGTYDIIKGQNPVGVDAFSALQLLVERSQARFASVFRARGNAYKDWFKFAIELERQFGPAERVKAVLTPARGYTFKTFKNAMLQGSMQVIIDDLSTTPKTSLAMRAALEHAQTLGMLNMQDPDQQYEGLKLFGLTRMVPSLDINVQAALQKQQAFEAWVADQGQVQKFVAAQQLMQQQQAGLIQQAQLQHTIQANRAAADPTAPLPQPVQVPPAPSPLQGSPLQWYPWYNAQIHLTEFMKWANDDEIRQLLAQNPIVEKLLTMHLQEIQQNLPQPPVQQEVPKISFNFAGADLADPQVRQAFDKADSLPVQSPPKAPPPMPPNPGKAPAKVGAGRAMNNSNRNSAPAGNTEQPVPGMK